MVASFTTTALVLGASFASASDLWVSPTGSDATGDGSRTRPFATLGAVQTAARAALARPGPMTADLTVHVGAGTYYQPAALRFGAADSGRDGFRVRWAGPGPGGGFEPATAAVVHGGVPVPGTAWARVPGSNTVWAANVTSLRPPTPVPSPTPAPTPSGGVPPVPNHTLPHCGTAFVGISYNGHDLASGEVLAGSVDACCARCAATKGCKAWSFCNLPPGEFCGDAASGHIDCYLKSAVPAAPSAFNERVSGVPGAGCTPTYPGPAPMPPAQRPWRFFNLVEARVGGVLARTPDFGGGYLKDYGCTNSNTALSCPKGVLPAALGGKGAVADASVFANIGANWFTETRFATGSGAAHGGGVTINFDGGSGGANNKIYLQGPKELISEAGEWALDSAAGMLYLWPRDQGAMAAGVAEVVVSTTARVLDIRGEGWEPHTIASAIDFDGIVLSGSDFHQDYGLGNAKKRTNDTPLPLREGMVRIENASDIHVERCALLDAGYSALWLQGFAQNVTVVGNWIERPGFCGVYAQGLYPGDTTAEGIGAIAGGPIASPAESYINKWNDFQSNLVLDYGRRVGHGSGFWWFQSGDSRAAHNHIQEGPRDAFGVYGVRFGGGTGNGVLPSSLYGEKLNFWKALDNLHTRRLEIDHNVVSNVIRDTADAGALEYWGVGAWNTAHHNCFRWVRVLVPTQRRRPDLTQSASRPLPLRARAFPPQ